MAKITLHQRTVYFCCENCYNRTAEVFKEAGLSISFMDDRAMKAIIHSKLEIGLLKLMLEKSGLEFLGLSGATKKPKELIRSKNHVFKKRGYRRI